MRTIVDNFPDGVVVVSDSSVVKYVNCAAEALFMRSRVEWIGCEFGYPLGDCEIQVSISNSETRVGEMRVRAIEWEGTPAHVVTIRDISERRRFAELERRLARADRRSSIGQLSASLAHEINNPTAFILANLTVMKEIIGDFETVFAAPRISRRLFEKYHLPQSLVDIREMLDDNALGLDRIRSFIREFKALSQETLEHVEMIDLNQVVATSAELVARRAGLCEPLKLGLGEIPMVVGDRLRLTQIVVHLIENAVAAVRTSGVEVAAVATAVEISTTHDLESVTVVVRDEGCGIPADNLRKIFEPLFTPNPERGIGLGLPVAAELASVHGGRIEVESKVGEGSWFRFILPRKSPLSLSEHTRGAAPGQVRARVLVIADDDGLGKEIVAMLGSAHDVMAGGASKDAFPRLDGDADYDVVLCDLTADSATVMRLHRELAERAPELAARFVFVAGDKPPESVERLVESARGRVVKKPLSGAILLDMVERMGR